MLSPYCDFSICCLIRMQLEVLWSAGQRLCFEPGYLHVLYHVSSSTAFLPVLFHGCLGPRHIKGVLYSCAGP
ncbi:hypothetical protein FKM82_010264 [Ascaphus truei]